MYEYGILYGIGVHLSRTRKDVRSGSHGMTSVTRASADVHFPLDTLLRPSAILERVLPPRFCVVDNNGSVERAYRIHRAPVHRSVGPTEFTLGPFRKIDRVPIDCRDVSARSQSSVRLAS